MTLQFYLTAENTSAVVFWNHCFILAMSNVKQLVELYVQIIFGRKYMYILKLLKAWFWPEFGYFNLEL